MIAPLKKGNKLFLTAIAVLGALVILPDLASAATEIVGPVSGAWRYVRVLDIFFMLMLVAFLMMFIKKMEWEVALATCLGMAGSFALYSYLKLEVLTEYFAVMPATETPSFWGLAIVMSITYIIAMGVPLGQVKHWQYLLLALLFVPCFLVLEYVEWEILEGVYDTGGSILVHMFAAYWGWGVIIGLQDKRKSVLEEPMRTTIHSVGWVWLAAMLLWMLWPSFVSVLLSDYELIWSTAITTYFAGFGSMLTAYLVLWAIEGKIDPLVYTYAMLGGLVAIGTLCDVVGIWAGFGIGLAAGVISALSFLYLAPFLTEKVGVLDSMGVNNLHGVCGIWGAIVAVPWAGAVELAAAGFCLIWGIISGAISGLITRAGGRMEPPFNDSDAFDLDPDRKEPF